MIEDSPLPSTHSFPSHIQVARAHAIQIGLAGTALAGAWAISLTPDVRAIFIPLWLLALACFLGTGFYLFPSELGVAEREEQPEVRLQKKAQAYLVLVYCVIAGMTVTLRHDPATTCLSLALLLTACVSGAWILIILKRLPGHHDY
jgi:hypothetical protein